MMAANNETMMVMLLYKRQQEGKQSTSEWKGEREKNKEELKRENK